MAIVNTPLLSLENHSLGDIQNWRDRDENIVAELVALIGTPSTVTDNLERGFFAAHAVAAGVTAALAPNANIGMIFNRMLDILKRMHDRNPSWGPLFVMHPGDLARHRTYMPQAVGTLSPPKWRQRARPGGSDEFKEHNCLSPICCHDLNAWCELAKSLKRKSEFTDTQTESRLVQGITL